MYACLVVQLGDWLRVCAVRYVVICVCVIIGVCVCACARFFVYLFACMYVLSCVY